MAKKKSKAANSGGTNGDKKPAHGVKSAAVREYLLANKGAKPKAVVEALKAKGIDVSPNMVSIIKAKAGIKTAKRDAATATASHDKTAAAQVSRSNGLEAALLLYKAARGQNVPQKQITSAFLGLVELLS